MAMPAIAAPTSGACSLSAVGTLEQQWKRTRAPRTMREHGTRRRPVGLLPRRAGAHAQRAEALPVLGIEGEQRGFRQLADGIDIGPVVPADERGRIERLCRSLLRPALASDRPSS